MIDQGGIEYIINEDDNSLNFDLCMEVSSYFRWKKDEARAEIEKIKTIRKSWEKRALKMKLKRTEIESMRPAFERAQ